MSRLSYTKIGAAAELSSPHPQVREVLEQELESLQGSPEARFHFEEILILFAAIRVCS